MAAQPARERSNVYADNAAELAATPEQIDAHKAPGRPGSEDCWARSITTSIDFLLSLSATRLGGIGLEHHRSSEDGVKLGYFLKWKDGPGSRNLLPHEYTHSWDGKYRRGADLWTPDYRTPMRGSLLWVYEGQTQFWGYVLPGALGPGVEGQDTLDMYASIMASARQPPGAQLAAIWSTPPTTR
jgi:predicted metalloprotease with PDZ domain